MRLPMFGFTLLSFLMLLVVIAIATWLVFRSGDGGKTKLSAPAGCAIGCAILLLGGLGALGCTAAVLISAPNEIVRRGPIERFELTWPDESQPAPADAATVGRYPARIRLTLRDGGRAEELAGEISRWLREETDGDLSVEIRRQEQDTVLEFSLPATREELEDLRRDLRREFPRLRLPNRVEVDVRDPDEPDEPGENGEGR